ncbi:YqjK-like family protein [Lonsdalea quercina]|uniref:YqjK-like family protein n=1 Tax=Lonsdalea quercina TaxID=71657 RepID=UPI00397707F3
MSRKRYLAQEKARLVSLIHQQRIELVSEKRQWLEATEPCDRYWQKLVGMRNYLIAGAGLVAVFGLRRPGRLLKVARKAAGVWGAIKLVRNILPRA